jgi:hypothetical protein
MKEMEMNNEVVEIVKWQRAVVVGRVGYGRTGSGRGGLLLKARKGLCLALCLTLFHIRSFLLSLAQPTICPFLVGIPIFGNFPFYFHTHYFTLGDHNNNSSIPMPSQSFFVQHIESDINK